MQQLHVVNITFLYLQKLFLIYKVYYRLTYTLTMILPYIPMY